MSCAMNRASIFFSLLFFAVIFCLAWNMAVFNCIKSLWFLLQPHFSPSITLLWFYVPLNFGIYAFIHRDWYWNPGSIIWILSPIGCRSCVSEGAGDVWVSLVRWRQKLPHRIFLSLNLFWIVISLCWLSPLFCGGYPYVFLWDYCCRWVLLKVCCFVCRMS